MAQFDDPTLPGNAFPPPQGEPQSAQQPPPPLGGAEPGLRSEFPDPFAPEAPIPGPPALQPPGAAQTIPGIPSGPHPAPVTNETLEPASILDALDVTLAHGSPMASPEGSAANTVAPGTGLQPTEYPQFAEQPPAPEVSVSSGERFELLGILGRGGMGKVFRACDRQIEGRKVALKVLHPQFSADKRFRELFFQEIRAAQGFVSEQVCQVRDTGQMADGSLFLTMDLVVGEPLARVLRREGALVPRQAFEIARQILYGLQSGHEHGLIHRDIKPSNIMLSARVPKTEDNPFGIGVKLLDFGIAGLAAEMPERERCGTPAYMSPEQVQGQRLDARTDLFAVGVVLYEMITGGRPFEGETLEQIETSLMETRVEPLVSELKTLPRPIRKILRKAMQKDREKRFQSAAQFLEAIERSKVFRPEGELGVFARTGIMAIGIAAGAEATIIWYMHNQTGDMQANIAVATAEATKEKDGEIARVSQRLAQKESELTLLQSRLLEEGDLGTKFVDLERDYSELREQNGVLQRRNDTLQSRVGDLEVVKREREFAELPEAKMAECFDEVLRRIDHGAGSSAFEYLKSRSRAGVFTLDQQDGKELVYHLAMSAAALELAQRSQEVDIRRLDEARSSLQQARKEELNFRLEAKSWLQVTAIGAQRVDRLVRLKDTFQLLSTQIQAASADGASSREEAWRSIATAPDDQDPAAAFAHAQLYGPASIGELIGRYAAHLDKTLVKSGQLDLVALDEAWPLRKWGAWLQGPGAGQTGKLATRLRSYFCAYEWYLARASEPAYAELFREHPVLGSDYAHHDWRAQLALQLGLASGHAYPQPADSSIVLHHTWTRSGAAMWFLERLQKTSSGAWNIERRIHNAEGATTGRPQTFEITRSDDAFFTEGFRGLDLRAVSSEVRVGVFHPKVDDALPTKPWLQEMDTSGYGRELNGASVPCLIINSGSTEMWFSPRFGLVREIRIGVYEREQVFFSSFR